MITRAKSKSERSNALDLSGTRSILASFSHPGVDHTMKLDNAFSIINQLNKQPYDGIMDDSASITSTTSDERSINLLKLSFCRLNNASLVTSLYPALQTLGLREETIKLHNTRW